MVMSLQGINIALDELLKAIVFGWGRHSTNPIQLRQDTLTRISIFFWAKLRAS
jgi:hypothetical protein